jgi:hypothetical protein
MNRRKESWVKMERRRKGLDRLSRDWINWCRDWTYSRKKLLKESETFRNTQKVSINSSGRTL